MNLLNNFNKYSYVLHTYLTQNWASLGSVDLCRCCRLSWTHRVRLNVSMKVQSNWIQDTIFCFWYKLLNVLFGRLHFAFDFNYVCCYCIKCEYRISEGWINWSILAIWPHSICTIAHCINVTINILASYIWIRTVKRTHQY
jgi:hypothetical protein